MAKRQRQKYKPLQSIYNLMHGLEQVTKGVMQKQEMTGNAKMLTRVLYKTATTLQHYHFVLLSKHNNHMKIC